MCVAYYAGAKIGLALTFAPMPIAVLWPPNALLLAALILTPRRWWPAVIAGAFPAHLLAELQGEIPLSMVLCWFVSNVSEALIGAALVRHFADAPGLRTLRAVNAFCAAAVLAPFASSFLDAGLVRWVGWSNADFSVLWQARFFSNMLAILTFVPVLLTWGVAETGVLRRGARGQLLEVGALVAGLFAVSVVVFDSGLPESSGPPTLLYLPVPFLIWAALRFGPALASASFAIVAFLVIWGASHGRGPFLAAAVQQDGMPIQLFLVSIAVPLLMLAALNEERREAEGRVRASEELFSTAFRRGPDAVAISRQVDGSMIEANERWLGLLGYAPGAALVAPFITHVEPASRPRVMALLTDPRPGREVEVELQDRQANKHAALASIAAVELRGEACHIMILRDITQQRQAEKDAREQRRQLTHLTRVASLSDFSSTIAHELNQPLTAILSNAQAALRFLSRDPPNISEIKAILGEIADADKRAGLLIHHLRLLMKKGEEEFGEVDINHLVADVLDFVRGEFLLRNVEVKTSYAPDLPRVLGDSVQLQQLVLNLVCNACEAMQTQPGSTKSLNINTLQAADGKVQVAVSDTGPGIPAERLERVFEPFFTTKESGLGLGLAICRRIATAHGGVLGADSRAGERDLSPGAATEVVPGSRSSHPHSGEFADSMSPAITVSQAASWEGSCRIGLLSNRRAGTRAPILAPMKTGSEAIRAEVTRAGCGPLMQGTVHIIDDDASVRSALERLLAGEGYHVKTYAAAGDYLLPAPDEDPGCLLLDVQLPGLSGLDLQAALHRHPQYQHPIVFLSGAADVAVQRARHARGGA